MAKLSSHLDDNVLLSACYIATVIAMQTTFLDMLHAMALREDEGYLLILVWQLSIQEHVLQVPR